MTATDPAEAVAARLFDASLATMDILSVALGDRLGLYRCLAGTGGLTAAELAAESGTVPRWTREWLEQQAATGLLRVRTGPGPTPEDDPELRRYEPAAGADEVLTDADGLRFLAPLARQLAAAARALPAVADCARDGGGVPWAEYGADMRESEADLNRPAYLRLLAQDWLPAVPGVVERLRSDPPARITDVGCGAGWAAIGMARAFPRVLVDAYDVDPESVRLARANVAARGLADRITVHECDIARAEGDGTCALVTAFECLHDLPHPVAALRAMRRLTEPGGTVLVGDLRTSDRFTAPAGDVDRLGYGFSVLVCLPDSLSSQDSAATGAVMRMDTLRSYAGAAGFVDVEILPIDHELWRFHRLVPPS
ncbi:class I SAM-dependent methyltransferase [Pseudonocardia alni]|uniref:class I SAM-dependent methyltransferase n=1 Tax=Pseudonocardia alni TaxID=33907 RepID=UPI003323DBBF